MWAFEVEFDFLFIEHMEHGDVVFAVAQVLQGVAECVGVAEQVGEDGFRLIF